MWNTCNFCSTELEEKNMQIGTQGHHNIIWSQNCTIRTIQFSVPFRFPLVLVPTPSWTKKRAASKTWSPEKCSQCDWKLKSSAQDDDPNAARRLIATTHQTARTARACATWSDHHPLPMSHTQSRMAPQKMPPKRQSTSKLPKAFCSGPWRHHRVHSFIRCCKRQQFSHAELKASVRSTLTLYPLGASVRTHTVR